VLSRSKPKISVITVVKDHRDGLMVTRNSILSQTSLDFEWLVVDGLSSDGTELVLSQLSSRQGIRIFRQPPSGIYPAMNFAVQNALGECVWFLNAGDFFLSSESVANMIKLIETNADISMFATSVLYFSKTQFLYDIKVPAIRQINGYRVADFHHQGVILQNTLLKRVGLFDEALKLASDGKMLDMCIEYVDPYLTSEPYVGFEMGGNSSKFYRKSLIEARSYRPIEIGNFASIYLQLKNSLRNFILLAESFAFTRFLVIPILNWKMKKIILANKESLNFKLDRNHYFR
jgi:glycosyltransferase involved in cell wall biosynthesis